MPHTHSLYQTRIWDLPTRAFHILLALCVFGLFITGEIAGEALQWHFYFGYTVLALVLFRIIWGFVGGHWSRFVNFIPSPSNLLAYARSLKVPHVTKSVGHNPLGALSVLTMLFLLLLQVFSGFMSDDEIANSGPWSALVPAEWVERATQYHSEIGKVLLLAFVALHVCAVLYHKRIQNDDLITPMLTGDKVLSEQAQASRDTFTSRLFALSILCGCVFVTYRLINLS